jgi:hypothetical protein
MVSGCQGRHGRPRLIAAHQATALHRVAGSLLLLLQLAPESDDARHGRHVRPRRVPPRAAGVGAGAGRRRPPRGPPRRHPPRALGLRRVPPPGKPLRRCYGATDGIGRAITFRLAGAGLGLVLVGRNPEKLPALCCSAEAAPSHAWTTAPRRASPSAKSHAVGGGDLVHRSQPRVARWRGPRRALLD